MSLAMRLRVLSAPKLPHVMLSSPDLTGRSDKQRRLLGRRLGGDDTIAPLSPDG
jgi:hypothetical protein